MRENYEENTLEKEDYIKASAKPAEFKT